MSAPRTTVPNGAKDFCDVLARVFEAPVPFFVGAGGGEREAQRLSSLRERAITRFLYGLLNKQGL